MYQSVSAFLLVIDARCRLNDFRTCTWDLSRRIWKRSWYLGRWNVTASLLWMWFVQVRCCSSKCAECILALVRLYDWKIISVPLNIRILFSNNAGRIRVLVEVVVVTTVFGNGGPCDIDISDCLWTSRFCNDSTCLGLSDRRYMNISWTESLYFMIQQLLNDGVYCSKAN